MDLLFLERFSYFFFSFYFHFRLFLLFKSVYQAMLYFGFPRSFFFLIVVFHQEKQVFHQYQSSLIIKALMSQHFSFHLYYGFHFLRSLQVSCFLLLHGELHAHYFWLVHSFERFIKNTGE